MNQINASNAHPVLSDQTLVGKGSVRDVSVHPQRPGYLIKVFNVRKLAKTGQGARGAARFARPHSPYDNFVREQNEYTRCVLLGHKRGCRVPIAEIAAVTLTDLVPGQVVSGIWDEQARQFTAF